LGLGVWVLGFGVWGLGLGVWGLRFSRAEGLWFMLQELGLRVGGGGKLVDALVSVCAMVYGLWFMVYGL